MKLTDYIKDRLWFYFIAALSFGLMLLFFTAYRVSGLLVAAIAVIFLLFIIAEELFGYFRKKAFYSELAEKTEALDKKYLVHEMVRKPLFFEGALIYEVLFEANKSMCENVADYRRSSAEFREFIEMWVHEVKLPVSSLQLMAHNHRDELGEKFLEQLRRIDGYTDLVLYYARSGSAEKDYIIKETPLKRTVANTALKYREDVQLAGACIETEGLDKSVMTDGKWLEFILGQFMVNSLKYTSPDRETVISISAEELSDRVVLHFRDNGIGIPENDIPRVFDKSFTGKTGDPTQNQRVWDSISSGISATDSVIA